jgi:hypothetical protein
LPAIPDVDGLATNAAVVPGDHARIDVPREQYAYAAVTTPAHLSLAA